MSKVLSNARRNVSASRTHTVAEPQVVESNCEIDNHADTCCIGSNFLPIYFTGKVCDVSPFLDTMPKQGDVEICTGATAYDNDRGETIILVINEALWMGDFMDHSLLNPYQIRASGISLCDDPTDHSRLFGMKVDDEEIHFRMQGSTCMFKTRTPTDWELQNCRQVELTDDREWNPNEVHFGMHVEHIASEQQSISVQAYDTRHRRANIQPEVLSRQWGIGLDTARNTLKCTTQAGIRHAIHPITRRYRTDYMNLRHRRLHTTFYSDTLFTKMTSLHGHKCAQVTSDGQFIHVIPMVNKANAGQALEYFVGDVGIPECVVVDNAPELVGRESDFQKVCRQFKIKVRQTEPFTPRQNRAELGIRELKRKWRAKMQQKAVPKRLWDYGLVWVSEIINRTARGPENRTPYEVITGNTPDISEWLDFDFYDWCWYWGGPTHELTEQKAELGKVLGVAHRVVSDLCYWILTEKAKVIARTTVQRVISNDLQTAEVQQAMKAFGESVTQRLNEDSHVIQPLAGGLVLDDKDGDPVDESEEQPQPHQDDFTPESYDAYLGAELLVPHGDTFLRGRVIKRSHDEDGNPIGVRNANPLLDTRQYIVQFGDDSTAEYAANVIAENLYSQCDEDGRQHLVFKEITDHRRDSSAISKENGFDVGFNGNPHKKKTTRGWDICVEWRDGTTSWLPLKDVKAANPVELADYAIANHIQDEPAFAWWIPDVLKRRNRIVNKLKTKYWRTTHKFGIEIPKTVEQALQIDRDMGTDYWRRAIEKEMKNVRIAFEKWDGGGPDEARAAMASGSLIGYQEIRCHMVFDIKMDGDLTRKARFVAGGHTTETPPSTTYSSVVSRESIRIAFLLAALNDLDIFAADVGNAYLNAPCREKIWTRAGKEFGSDEGSVMIIVRALYGLKSSGAAWRATFAQKLMEMGYVSSKADPDVWLRAAVKPNGHRYYEMLLVYVDDILCISHNPRATMSQIQELYRLKDDLVGPPKRYLGANIAKYQLPDGSEAWSASARDYVMTAVRNLEETLSRDPISSKLRNRVDRPLPISYRPEVDVSPLLGQDMVTRFQTCLGVLRWIVELGRLDILLEVSMLSAHNAMPREGHLEAVYHIFAYLKGHENSR